jgi:exodeoxyribonuclease X
MKLIVLDTETSDLDPDKGAEVLQLAWIELQKINEVWQPTFSTDYYIEFHGQIAPKAHAVHHIPPERLTKERGAIGREEAFNFLLQHIDSDSLMVAHNVDFDSKFFPMVTRPWICTFRAARHIWPNALGYSNQVLRYWLDLDIFKISAAVQHRFPHEALYDAATTTSILLRMLENHTPEQLLALSSRPVRLKTIGFGKHKGQEFSTIPLDYLRWLRSNTKDEDVKHTIDSMMP